MGLMLLNVLKGSILGEDEHPKRGGMSHLSGKGDHPDPAYAKVRKKEYPQDAQGTRGRSMC